jgi:hypothetical protein
VGAIKEVVSVSLGSSTRDHEVEIDLLGEEFRLRREGVDGDFQRAVARLSELDGRVDALSLGGIDLYLRAAGHDYRFRAAKPFARAVIRTPLVCGAALKGPLEQATVRYMRDELGLLFEGKRTLVTSAVDRYGLAEGLLESGCDMRYGDLLYALGIPVLIQGKHALDTLIHILAPVVVQLPFSWLYPTGSAQEAAPSANRTKMYRDFDIIAGDFQYVRKYMPDDMAGKWVVTNTTTSSDVDDMRKRGVELLVTTTPRLAGRSFGTNVIEAALIALAGASGELNADEYLRLLAEVDFRPDVQWLQREHVIGNTEAEVAQSQGAAMTL